MERSYEMLLGVGRVTSTMVPAKDFMVKTAQGERPALAVLRNVEQYKRTVDDPELSEYFVGVTWLDTVPMDRAVNEVGLFGNQNTVCQPVTPKWRHTVERLKEHFPKWDTSLDL